MNRTFNAAKWGLRIEVRAPTLEELTALRRAGGSPDAARKLVRACLVSPSLTEVLAKAPGAVLVLLGHILSVYGLTAELSLLDEEDYDEETAKAVVEAERKGFSGLFVVAFAPETEPATLSFVLRVPRDQELAEVMRDAIAAGTFAAFAAQFRADYHGG